MWRTTNRRAWVKPERLWRCCLAPGTARSALCRGRRITEGGLLLGMKLTRAALSVGIHCLQRDLERDRPARHSFRKIEIQ